MRYLLKAVNDKRNVVALEVEAIDEMAARDTAQQQGLTVLAIHGPGLKRFGVWSRPSRFRVTLFSIELLALLDAGLNLVEALHTLAQKSSDPVARRILEDILRSLNEGVTFSQAIARQPQRFPPLYVATVQSSERTGNVREALGRYIAYEEEVDRVRKKVVSALIYPAILTLVGGGVLTFLLFYVVPRFAGVYEDLNTELPFFSAVLLTVGRLVRDHGGTVAVVLATALGMAMYVVAQDRTRAAIATRLWSVPALGERLRIYQLARFYRTAGMLLRAGVPVLKTLDMVAALLAAHLRLRLQNARRMLEEGRPISVALTDAGLATPVATNMMLVGERGGQMGEMMDRIARFYDDETARTVDALTRIFEPLLMAVLGLAVGLVVVLMYMPVFELAGSIR